MRALHGGVISYCGLVDRDCYQISGYHCCEDAACFSNSDTNQAVRCYYPEHHIWSAFYAGVQVSKCTRCRIKVNFGVEKSVFFSSKSSVTFKFTRNLNHN